MSISFATFSFQVDVDDEDEGGVGSLHWHMAFNFVLSDGSYFSQAILMQTFHHQRKMPTDMRWLIRTMFGR